MTALHLPDVGSDPCRVVSLDAVHNFRDIRDFTLGLGVTPGALDRLAAQLLE